MPCSWEVIRGRIGTMSRFVIGRPISPVITATGRPPSTAINANRHSGITVACTESPGSQPASTSH